MLLYPHLRFLWISFFFKRMLPKTYPHYIEKRLFFLENLSTSHLYVDKKFFWRILPKKLSTFLLFLRRKLKNLKNVIHICCLFGLKNSEGWKVIHIHCLFELKYLKGWKSYTHSSWVIHKWMCITLFGMCITFAAV
jgi:hypothetical protein